MIRAFGKHHPVIASSAFVSESAVIIGQVKIGEHTGLWPDAVIRADFGRIEVDAGSHEAYKKLPRQYKNEGL